jgi:nitronate monooxygenase
MSLEGSAHLLELLDIRYPIIQAPMAGTDTPSGAAHHTVMTAGISGRPARCLSNRFTALVADVSAREIPAYPVAYKAGKALNAAAKAKGEPGYGAQWAGQGAPLARALPAAELIGTLIEEMQAAP